MRGDDVLTEMLVNDDHQNSHQFLNVVKKQIEGEIISYFTDDESEEEEEMEMTLRDPSIISSDEVSTRPETIRKNKEMMALCRVPVTDL